MKTILRTFVILLLVQAFACKQKIPAEVAVEKKVPVKLAPVKTVNRTIGVEASGVLEPSNLVRLSFKTGGIISQIYVEEGQQVKKGEILAKLDNTEIDQRLAQTAAGKSQATINIERATLALDKAKRDLESAEALYRDSVIIEDDLKNAQTAFNLAQRELALATESLSMAESNEKIARFNADHSVIYAPSGGKILKKLAEPKELTGPGMPVLVFSEDKSRLSLKVGLTEGDVVKINLGDTAKVQFFAYPGKDFSGLVNEISPTINPESATFDIEIKIDPQGKKLLPGFIANVVIFPNRSESFLTVPAQALIDANGKTGYVFTLNDSREARRILVSIVDVFENDVIIDPGSEPLDSVISVGVEYLFSGTKVILIKE